MTVLSDTLGAMYRTEVLGKGDRHAIRRSAKAIIQANPEIRKEARDMLSGLKQVDIARRGKDYVTRKQVEYLEEILNDSTDR